MRAHSQPASPKTRRKASFVREHTVGSNTTEYTYDDAGQLIREEKPWLSWDREYEYDGNGNRKKHFHNATEYRYIYDPGDQLKVESTSTQSLLRRDRW